MSNQLRLLLFIVVISGALCTVEDYVIMSQCAHNKAIHLAAEGTVSVTDISQTQNITIVGLPDYVNNDFKIALYAKETQRYLCFNENWKLVGMKELQDTCYFNETIVHGYFVFRSVLDLQRRVGFTHRGKAIGPKKNVNDACYLFTKMQADLFFQQHTDYFALKPKTTSATLPHSTVPGTSLTTTTTTTTAGGAANRSKASRNKNNRYSGGMRNNSNNNQNQQHSNGHSSKISSYSTNSSRNSTNLSHTKPQVVISQPQQPNTREAVQQQQHPHQQQHQVRHHHNDPNLVARRQQHEHKQKRRQRNRTRATASPSAAAAVTATKQASERIHATASSTSSASTSSTANTTSSIIATTTTTQTAFSTTAAAAATSRYKQHEISPTNVVHPATSTLSSSASTFTSPSTMLTTAANKRKGRRRKGERMHKKNLQQRKLLKQQQQLPSNSKESHHRRTSDVEATLPTFDNETEQTATYMSPTTYDDVASTMLSSSSTDYSSAYTNEWSSVEPSSSTATPTFETSFETLAFSPSSFASSSSTTTTDFDTDATSLATDDDIAFTTAQNKNMLATDVAATSTHDDSNILLATPTIASPSPPTNSINNENRFYSTPSVATDGSPSATFTLDDTWSPATFYDELETTINGEPLLAPTPILTANTVDDDSNYSMLPITYETKHAASDDYATTTSTENDTSSSFGSTSSEPTEAFSETDATATTTTFNDDEIVDNIYDSSNFSENVLDVDEPLKNTSSMSQQEYYSSTRPGQVAATLATLLYPKFGTTKKPEQQQQQHVQYSKQLKASTTASAMVASTPWRSRSNSNISDNIMTEYIYSTRSSNIHKNSRHRNVSNNENQQQHQQQQQQLLTSNTSNLNKKYPSESNISQKFNRHHSKMHSKSPAAATTTTATRTTPQKKSTRAFRPTTTVMTSTASTLRHMNPMQKLFPLHGQQQHVASNNSNDSHLLSINKNINNSNTNNTLTDTVAVTPTSSSSIMSTSITATATSATTRAKTTKKSFRKSTQRLLATPFHQLTYVRNGAGDIDIDNIDNISVYPDLMDANDDDDDDTDGDAIAHYHNNSGSSSGNSRLTNVNGYLPTSATLVLPELLRIAKIRIQNEQKRILRQRHIGSYA